MKKSKHELMYTNGDGVTVKFIIDGDICWPEFCQQFKQYLLACGFSLPEGNLVIEEGENE